MTASPLKDWQSCLNLNNANKQKIAPILYRPFDKRFTFYTGKSRGFICMPRQEVMQHMLLGENLGLITCRQQSQQGCEWSLVGVTDSIIESCAISNKTKEINSLFPLYLYPTQQSTLFDHDPDHHTRKPNFSPAFITDLETRLQLTFIPENKGDFEQTLSALDVFHYLYAVFHSPTYRTRYAEFLKMDFPRLPLISDKTLFKQLADLGEQLVSLHLMDGKTNQGLDSNKRSSNLGLYDSEHCFPIAGDNLVEKIDYRDHKIYINKTQYFDFVTPELWAFHIGGYQVCQKWLKDRKGRQLSYDDCNHYLTILAALEHTQILMLAIDDILIFPVL